MEYNNIDSVKSLDQMFEKIALILDIDNKYYITNIIIKIVTITFDVEKTKDEQEIRILMCYSRCLEILDELIENNKKNIEYNQFIQIYQNILYKENK